MPNIKEPKQKGNKSQKSKKGKKNKRTPGVHARKQRYQAKQKDKAIVNARYAKYSTDNEQDDISWQNRELFINGIKDYWDDSISIDWSVFSDHEERQFTAIERESVDAEDDDWSMYDLNDICSELDF